MAKLKILIQGNPILKKKAKAVKKVTKDHQKLIDNMVETMIVAPGVGLAAPQVGISERIIVVLVEGQLYCVINPKITKRSGKIACYEGCLSVPLVEAPVERFKNICVKGMDKSGKPVTINAQDLLSVVFQHEIDHLDGVLFIDRVKDPSLIRLKDQKEEITI